MDEEAIRINVVNLIAKYYDVEIDWVNTDMDLMYFAYLNVDEVDMFKLIPFKQEVMAYLYDTDYVGTETYLGEGE